MKIEPYLMFDGRCEEALEFYKKALGAKVEMLMRFKEAPGDQKCAPGNEEKIMHAALRIGDTQVVASDGMAQGKPEFKGFSLTLNAKDKPETERLFAALSAGGQVRQPLIETFFSPSFGMCADKFGVGWMVMVPSP